MTEQSRWRGVVLSAGACALLWLVGCSEALPPRVAPMASGGSPVDVTPGPEQQDLAAARLRPVAASVGMSGTPRVGEVVTGTYRWMADWPETASIHRWEVATGPTRIRVVGRTREWLPSAGLRGARVRYCVKPVIGQGETELTGHKSCTAWTTVDAGARAAG